MKKWSSRKFQLAAATFGLPFLVITIALFTGKADASQWISFVQMLVPSVLGIYGFANVAATHASKDSKKSE